MRKNILVVDDEADIQEVLHILLESSNYEVTSAADGEEVIEKLEAGFKPDIILLDLMMPHMSGYTLLNELKRRELHHDFSIIVMSADVFTHQQILSMGIKAFITKPFDLDELLQLIEQV